ncbi:hypothetical protein AG1IA_00734 [Rhizoctonia solani AG-1 IA]|uniref:Uncharacterized protein n=1 Tax=Thanatephorus cucumeris (strain AG1-IA) TaxID=983506 RepID=L8X4W0_THACA|nr:hypothetical protein AG1IA_00734 [Rhizoctonia solani AG-1 IA]
MLNYWSDLAVFRTPIGSSYTYNQASYSQTRPGAFVEGCAYCMCGERAWTRTTQTSKPNAQGESLPLSIIWPLSCDFRRSKVVLDQFYGSVPLSQHGTTRLGAVSREAVRSAG